MNEQQIVLAAEITIDSPDFGHLEPMVDATHAELEKAGFPDKPEIHVLIPPDSKKRDGARPGWDGGYYAFTRRVLATEHASSTENGKP